MSQWSSNYRSGRLAQLDRASQISVVATDPNTASAVKNQYQTRSNPNQRLVGRRPQLGYSKTRYRTNGDY